MDVKGINKLREKLPKYRNRLKLLPLVGLFAMMIGLCVMIFFDIIARVFVDYAFLVVLEPLMPLVGVALCEVIAFILVTSIWRNRERWQTELDDLAYQHALPRGATGVFVLFGILLHGYVSVRSLPPGPPLNDLTIYMSKSLLPMVGVPPEFDLCIRLILGASFILLAMMTARRAILTFGLDYMLVVYLYFPEESEMQEREIYSVIRHPAYFSGVLGGIGYIMLRFSIYSLILFVLLVIFLKAFIAVEERELVERFGESYQEYMREVPGLYVKPRKIGVFLRFLAGRSE